MLCVPDGMLAAGAVTRTTRGQDLQYRRGSDVRAGVLRPVVEAALCASREGPILATEIAWYVGTKPKAFEFAAQMHTGSM